MVRSKKGDILLEVEAADEAQRDLWVGILLISQLLVQVVGRGGGGGDELTQLFWACHGPGVTNS